MRRLSPRACTGVLVGAMALAAADLAEAKVQATSVAAPTATQARVAESTADERAKNDASRLTVEKEQWDEALTLTLDLVDRFGRPEYLARLAAIYGALHRPVDETATWERFMDVAPRAADACPAVGRAYRGLGQYEHAIAAFKRCLASDPTSAKQVYFLGLGYEWAGQLELAREHYRRATALAPPGHDYQVSLARLDLHEGRLASARDRAAAVLAQVPTHAEGALVAGLAEQRAGRHPGARRFLEMAAALAPEYFDVRLALGILDYSESRSADARGHFEAAFLADPSRRTEVQPWLDRTLTAK